MKTTSTDCSKHDRRHFLGLTAITLATAQASIVAAAQLNETKPTKSPATGEAPATAQSSAKIIVNPPLPEPLAGGFAFIEYRTENLRILPVFGPKALEVSPRVGHLHVTVDDTPWHWAETSGNPVIAGPLPAGPHKVELLLVDANHQPLDRGVVEFVVPERKALHKH